MAVIPLDHFTRASRMRLASRLRDQICRMGQGASRQAISDATVEIGRLIHCESGLLYEQAEMSEQMKLAPWLHVIGKLGEEYPQDFGNHESRSGLRNCVEVYIESITHKQATA